MEAAQQAEAEQPDGEDCERWRLGNELLLGEAGQIAVGKAEREKLVGAGYIGNKIIVVPDYALSSAIGGMVQKGNIRLFLRV